MLSDPKSPPEDPEILKQMLVDLSAQLDKTQRVLGQLLRAKSGTHSEELSADRLRPLAQDLGIADPTVNEDNGQDPPAASDSYMPPPLDPFTERYVRLVPWWLQIPLALLLMFLYAFAWTLFVDLQWPWDPHVTFRLF